MCRVANGAKRTGAVSPRVRMGWPDAARESRPSSVDLSRIFSTPMTSTTSWTPLATAIVSYDWSKSSPNLISPAPTTATRFQLTVLSACLFLHRQGSRLPPVDGHAALVRVPPQHQLDVYANLDVVAVTDRLQHDPRAILQIDDRDRQRGDERCRHRLVDDKGVHRAAPGERHGFELRAAARDARRMDRRRSADRAAVRAATAEQLEHLLRSPREQRALRRHAHRDHLAGRGQLAPS